MAGASAQMSFRDQLGDAYDSLYELAKSQMDSYRFKMKK